MDQPKKKWLAHNWKWLVPAGCLTTILVCLGIAVLILTLVFGMMKSSDAYKEAVGKARSNPDVLQSLGSPIKEGYFVSGHISVTGPSGRAELAIPISGPKGKGTIYLEAEKSAGKWQFSKLIVGIKATDERVNLLEDGHE